jgi:hypothetical protein
LSFPLACNLIKEIIYNRFYYHIIKNAIKSIHMEINCGIRLYTNWTHILIKLDLDNTFTYDGKHIISRGRHTLLKKYWAILDKSVIKTDIIITDLIINLKLKCNKVEVRVYTILIIPEDHFSLNVYQSINKILKIHIFCKTKIVINEIFYINSTFVK